MGAGAGGERPPAAVQAQASLPRKKKHNSGAAAVVPKKEFRSINQYHEEGPKRQRRRLDREGNEEKIRRKLRSGLCTSAHSYIWFWVLCLELMAPWLRRLGVRTDWRTSVP